MAGIFDFLTPSDPMKQQSLLAAAAAMLQASGPSRTPTSFGQALAGGITGYQQSQADQLHRAMQQHALEQSFKLNDLSIKDKESDLNNQELLRDRQSRIVKRLQGLQGVPKLGDNDPAATNAAQSMAPAMPGGAMSPRIGGPDWLQAYQKQNGLGMPAAMPQGVGAPTAGPQVPAGGANLTQGLVARLSAEAQVRSEEGDVEGANKLLEHAAKFMPEVHKIEVGLSDGKPVNVITYKDGRQEVSQFGAKPDMTEMDLGGSKQFIDKNSVKAGTTFRKTQSPDSIAVDRRAAADRTASPTGASMDADTLEFQADRALRGDRTVFQGLGRGTQGAANLIALNQRIAQKAKAAGLTGGDLASINADYDGQKAALRTSGNISARVENAIAEADQLAPLAVAAGRDVARSGLMPFGKAQVMFDAQTNDPALKKFVTANNGLISAYAGAMARGQKPTVSDYDHARHILAEAQSQEAYEATVAQMRQEMRAASAAPRTVREHLRGEISGAGSHATGTVPNPVANSPAKTGGVKFLGFE